MAHKTSEHGLNSKTDQKIKKHIQGEGEGEGEREMVASSAIEVAHGVVSIGPLLWEGLIEHSTKVLEATMSNYKSQMELVANQYTSNHLTCISSS